ncbi:MAG: hypothetical protein IIC78_09945 [Chloroflexi bacterium]|nr:hypothetical protein [Chloroflexota bacterium]
MSDPLDKITEDKDFLGKIRNTLSGFMGYADRENRRQADKLLREQIGVNTRSNGRAYPSSNAS